MNRSDSYDNRFVAPARSPAPLGRLFRGSHGSAGFTLIEMTLVVIIIGLLASIVFPRLENTMPKHALRAGVNEVLAAAAFARSQARLKQYDIDLTYYIDKNTIAIETYFVEEDGAVVQSQKPDVLMSRQMPKGVKISEVHYGESKLISSGLASATFRPSGAVAEHMVVLENDDGDTVSIYVPALTGAAFVVEDGTTYEQLRSQRRLK